MFCHESLKLVLLFLRNVNKIKKGCSSGNTSFMKVIFVPQELRKNHANSEGLLVYGLRLTLPPPAYCLPSPVLRLLHGPGVLPANGPSAFLGKRSIRSAFFSKKVTLIRKACISDSTEKTI